jgi:hypothetical protein
MKSGLILIVLSAFVLLTSGHEYKLRVILTNDTNEGVANISISLSGENAVSTILKHA